MSWILFRGAVITALMLLPQACLVRNSGPPHPSRAPELTEKAPASGFYHKVRAGETLRSIAQAYKVDLQALAEVNNIGSSEAPAADSELFIPRRSAPATVGRMAGSGESEVEPIASDRTLDWPVEGEVASEFGVHAGVQRNGIEIQAGNGAQVRAAADGRVGYSGLIKGFGAVVIIEHPERIRTVYARMKQALAANGNLVRRGDAIGTAESTGNGDRCPLYFEVRVGLTPRNPRSFLKPPSTGRQERGDG